MTTKRRNDGFVVRTAAVREEAAKWAAFGTKMGQLAALVKQLDLAPSAFWLGLGTEFNSLLCTKEYEYFVDFMTRALEGGSAQFQGFNRLLTTVAENYDELDQRNMNRFFSTFDPYQVMGLPRPADKR